MMRKGNIKYYNRKPLCYAVSLYHTALRWNYYGLADTLLESKGSPLTIQSPPQRLLPQIVLSIRVPVNMNNY